MTRIEYDITPDDWADFGEYHARTSAQCQRVVHMGVTVGILLILAIATAWSAVTHSLVWLYAGLALGAAWGFYWPRRVIANVRTSMARKDQPCLRGRHMMESLPEGLRAKCDVSDSTTGWTAIHDVVQTPDHVFVILHSLQGYVIPRKRVTSGELDLFVREVAQRRVSAG